MYIKGLKIYWRRKEILKDYQRYDFYVTVYLYITCKGITIFLNLISIDLTQLYKNTINNLKFNFATTYGEILLRSNLLLK